MNPAQFDPNAELYAAQAAIQNRQPQVAVTHLARVVPQFPLHPHVLGLLEQLVATSPNPLQLVSHGVADYGAAAIQAYVLGRVGRGSEAYAILRQLASGNPAGGIIDWALPWLDAKQLPEPQRAEAVALYFASASYRFTNRKNQPPEVLAVVKCWLPHARSVMASKPFNDPNYAVYIPMLRQAGEMDEAIRLCQARHRAEGSYHSAVSLAATFREAGKFSEWLAATKEILRVAPNDVPARLDLGDCYWDEQKNLEQAENWYADALRLEPEQPWAKPSLLCVRYLRTDEAKWRDELEDYAEAHPQDQRTQVCLARVTPYFTDFTYPADGSINNMAGIAKQIDEARAKGNNEPIKGQIKSTTTGLDMPSCYRSIDRQIQLWGGGIVLKREMLGMQSPDPRQPRVPVRYRLWNYDGTTPLPAVPPPPANVVAAVAQLAGVPYDLGAWISYAVQIGGQLGEQNILAILGVMAYPPDPPQGVRTWDWTLRIQFAATLILAGTGPNALDVLCDLANGPLDWPTAAAVVALTAIARSRMDLVPRLRQLFTELYRDLPRPGAVYYENVILNCHLRLPGLPPTERAAVRANRAEYESRTRQRMSEAEIAASVFLARPVPPGTNQSPLIRQVIESFMRPEMQKHPGFLSSLDTLVSLADTFAKGAQGEAKKYLDEQASVARKIQGEMKAKK